LNFVKAFGSEKYRLLFGIFPDKFRSEIWLLTLTFNTGNVPPWVVFRAVFQNYLLFSILANTNSRSRLYYAIARQSVVCLSICNVRAPFSGGSNFQQYLYGIRYLGHPLTATENFTEIVPGEPLRQES